MRSILRNCGDKMQIRILGCMTTGEKYLCCSIPDCQLYIKTWTQLLQVPENERVGYSDNNKQLVIDGSLRQMPFYTQSASKGIMCTHPTPRVVVIYKQDDAYKVFTGRAFAMWSEDEVFAYYTQQFTAKGRTPFFNITVSPDEKIIKTRSLEFPILDLTVAEPSAPLRNPMKKERNVENKSENFKEENRKRHKENLIKRWENDTYWNMLLRAEFKDDVPFREAHLVFNKAQLYERTLKNFEILFREVLPERCADVIELLERTKSNIKQYYAIYDPNVRDERPLGKRPILVDFDGIDIEMGELLLAYYIVYVYVKTTEDSRITTWERFIPFWASEIGYSLKQPSKAWNNKILYTVVHDTHICKGWYTNNVTKRYGMSQEDTEKDRYAFLATQQSVVDYIHIYLNEVRAFFKSDEVQNKCDCFQTTSTDLKETPYLFNTLERYLIQIGYSITTDRDPGEGAYSPINVADVNFASKEGFAMMGYCIDKNDEGRFYERGIVKTCLKYIYTDFFYGCWKSILSPYIKCFGDYKFSYTLLTFLLRPTGFNPSKYLEPTNCFGVIAANSFLIGCFNPELLKAIMTIVAKVKNMRCTQTFTEDKEFIFRREMMTQYYAVLKISEGLAEEMTPELNKLKFWAEQGKLFYMSGSCYGDYVTVFPEVQDSFSKSRKTPAFICFIYTLSVIMTNAWSEKAPTLSMPTKVTAETYYRGILPAKDRAVWVNETEKAFFQLAKSLCKYNYYEALNVCRRQSCVEGVAINLKSLSRNFAILERDSAMGIYSHILFL